VVLFLEEGFHAVERFHSVGRFQVD